MGPAGDLDAYPLAREASVLAQFNKANALTYSKSWAPVRVQFGSKLPCRTP